MFVWWLDAGYLDIGVLLLAVALDLLLPEPPAAVHPVVWMGKAIAVLERAAPKAGAFPRLVAGTLIGVAVPGAFGAGAWAVAAALRDMNDAAYLAAGALLLRTTFTVRGLARAALDTRRALESGDAETARSGLKRLVSRDTGTLTASLMAGAAVESVAENTTDSYIGPWLAFALLGLPGAVAYRAVNTLDSMVGYHEDYEHLGKASARLDDLLNLIPARLSALMLLAVGAMTGLPVRQGWRWMLRDHAKTESPNAGWTLGAMAGLLGVTLEKPSHYRLGDGLRAPEASDIHRAARLAYGVAALGVVITVGLLLVRWAVLG